jgi:hypothetical protein
MKKFSFILMLFVTLLMVANAGAQMRTLVERFVVFDSANGNVQFTPAIDISDCWVPLNNVGTAIGAGTDSLWVFAWNSTIFNTADSGAVAVDMGLSNEFAKPSKGFAGTSMDSLLFETDTCCTKGGYSTDRFNSWFRVGTPVLCAANADTIVIHASATGNRTEVSLGGRIVTSMPKKYAYFRYTAAAGNSGYNKAKHTVLVHDTSP